MHNYSLGLADKVVSRETNAGIKVQSTVGLAPVAVSTGSSQDTACEHRVRASEAKTLCFGASEGSEGSGKDSGESGEVHFSTGKRCTQI